jgi:hypothetical protein
MCGNIRIIGSKNDYAMTHICPIKGQRGPSMGTRIIQWIKIWADYDNIH